MSGYRAAWVCPACLATNPPAETACGRCGLEIAPGGDGDE